MSNYSQFFLNSASSVIQLELLEIFHPSFSKRYRIVRNAINGITVTLEDTSSGVFEYYPVKIKPTGSANDLDQTLELQFGDLGQIIPSEIDRLLFQFDSPQLYQDSFFGVWVDAAQVIVSSPFQIGTGCVVYVPANAVYLSMGLNNNGFFNSLHWDLDIDDGSTISHLSVNSWCIPWSPSLNPAYPFAITGGIAPQLFAVTPGKLLKLTTSGLAGNTHNNGNGDLSKPIPGTPGIYPATYVKEVLPSSITKPIILYRTYRSDDLTTPLFGPVRFQINSIAFQKEGATMQCSAPRLNLGTTGEIYSMDRFPMLRGFL